MPYVLKSFLTALYCFKIKVGLIDLYFADTLQQKYVPQTAGQKAISIELNLAEISARLLQTTLIRSGMQKTQVWNPRDILRQIRKSQKQLDKEKAQDKKE